MNVSLGDRLKELRIEKGMTQEELCDALNKKYNTAINKGMISKWENNKEQPRLEFIISIADYFNVYVDYLLGFKKRMYGSSNDETQKVINKFIPKLTDLLNSICSLQENLNIDVKLRDNSYVEIALMITNEISALDFYSIYDLFDSEIYQNLDNYLNSSVAEAFTNIEKDINTINIYNEIKIYIKEVFFDDFYNSELKESITKLTNDNELTEIIVSSIYNSEVMESIITNISKIIETNYFNIIIKEITHEYFEKLNVIGKGKVLDYIKDLLSNDKYKEGD